jgi:hypothetical protein
MLARPLPASALVMSLCIGLPAAHAGTVLETTTRDLAGKGGTTNITTWAQNGMMRVETKPNDTVMIFKDDTIYSVNHKEKSYYAMDRAAMKRMAEQVNPALKALQEQMKNMSPEQRAQMEKMMGGHMPGGMGGAPKKEELKRTSRTGKIAGYSCTYVEMFEDGVLTDEMCVAPSASMKGSEDLIAAAKKMASLMKEMMAGIDAPWLTQMADKQTANFEKLGGIPVFSRHFAGGQPQHETTLTSMRSESAPGSTFELPAGYTKKDMMTAR